MFDTDPRPRTRKKDLERKRADAKRRQAAREARTNEEQLVILASRGITGGKEFNRLTKSVAK